MFDLKLDEHPARAPHPLYPSKPLTREDGSTVPLFPDHGSVRFEGRIIAYVSPGPNVAFIIPGLPQELRDSAVELVKANWGEARSVTEVPKLRVDDE